MKSIDIIVKGHVQGVGFRYHTHKAASELNISGFVKNLPDGFVFIKATGNEPELELFLNWCKQGPRLARVEKVEVTESVFERFDGFTIR